MLHAAGLGQHLQRRLLEAPARPEGWPPRSSMAPALSYGRHRGPASRSSRLAAIAVALYQNPAGDWMIPLTLRPTSLKYHGGQISLPGGSVESGETLIDAALREFEEELGVRPSLELCCGELSTQYVYASDNRVHPIVMVIDPPQSPWQPDPTEVAEVIPMPLQVLFEDTRRIDTIKQKPIERDGVSIGKLVYRAPAIAFGEHQIWGATALVLDELARLLQR